MIFTKILMSIKAYLEAYGYPLVLPNVEEDAVLSNYKIWGNSTQSTTPSPSAPVEVKAVGVKTRNMWDDDSYEIGYLYDDGTVRNATDYKTSGYFEVTPGDFYTAYMSLSEAFTGNCIWFCFYDSNKALVNTREGMYIPEGEYLFDVEVPDEAVYMRVSMGSNSKTAKHMLTKGQYTLETLNYEPYGYKIPITATNGTTSSVTNVFLDRQLYRAGDCADCLDFKENQIVRNVGVKVLDGTETDWDSDFYNDYFYTNDNCFVDMSLEYAHISVLSSHFTSEAYTAAEDTSKNNCCFAKNNQYYASIGFRDKSITDLDTWKAFLTNQKSAGTPVIVYYPLAASVTEVIELPELPVYSGTTTYTIEGLEPNEMYGKR